MIIYISGPITGVPDYKERFAAAGQLLLERDITVINPANMDKLLKGREANYGNILKMDMKLLELCDGILMLPGWEHSLGARTERQWMIDRKRPVWYAEETPEETDD